MTYSGYSIDSLHGDEDYFHIKDNPELYEDNEVWNDENNDYDFGEV